MSQPPRIPDTIALLADRADRYAARARDLAEKPGLTMQVAADALDHMAELQMDLKRAGQWDQRLAPHAARLKAARAVLSSALLGAEPTGEVAFGIVPHGSVADVDKQTAVCPVSACRAFLDLEALRPYLDEASLRQAIERYTATTRRHDVLGVTYARLPASAHLPCPVQ